MNQLVFVEKDQVVTDSLMVAQVFEKRHADVLKSIETLACSEEFSERNFSLANYEDQQGKPRKSYLIKRDGLVFLVMGYTGDKAAEFKEMYIEAFNKMENELNRPKVLSEKEQLMASMKLSLETAEEIATVKEDVAELKHTLINQLTLDHGQQVALHHAIKQRVESIKGDYEVSSYKLYNQLHSHLRRAFAAPKYFFVKRKDFQDAMSWVKSWRPLL